MMIVAMVNAALSKTGDLMISRFISLLRDREIKMMIQYLVMIADFFLERAFFSVHSGLVTVR